MDDTTAAALAAGAVALEAVSQTLLAIAETSGDLGAAVQAGEAARQAADHAATLRRLGTHRGGEPHLRRAG